MPTRSQDILVVDDEQVILDAVQRICTEEGFRVDTALDASVALSKIHARRYNLIICDILMPEMDGFQLLDHLGRKGRTIPVIMASGFATVENAVKSLYAGAIDFIPKPFTADELLSAVRRGLRYGEIQSLRRSRTVPASDTKVFYAPCPPKYARLGYMSWASLDEDGIARIGVTHLFLKTIDRITALELMQHQEEVIQGTVCAQIRGTESLSHSVLAPISGTIIEAHHELAADTSLLEKDPYFNGWIYRLIPRDVEYEMAQLIPCSSE